MPWWHKLLKRRIRSRWHKPVPGSNPDRSYKYLEMEEFSENSWKFAFYVGKIDSGISTGVVPDSKKKENLVIGTSAVFEKKQNWGIDTSAVFEKKNKIEKSAPCASYDKNANSAISWCRFEALPYSPDMKERTSLWKTKALLTSIQLMISFPGTIASVPFRKLNTAGK